MTPPRRVRVLRVLCVLRVRLTCVAHVRVLRLCVRALVCVLACSCARPCVVCAPVRMHASPCATRVCAREDERASLRARFVTRSLCGALACVRARFVTRSLGARSLDTRSLVCAFALSRARFVTRSLRDSGWGGYLLSLLLFILFVLVGFFYPLRIQKSYRFFDLSRTRVRHQMY